MPGDDRNVQDEESEAGGGGIQPGSHQRPFILPGPRQKDLRPHDRGDLPSDRRQGNQTLTRRLAGVGLQRRNSSFTDLNSQLISGTNFEQHIM